MAKQFTLFENALQFAAMFSGLKRTFSEEFNGVRRTEHYAFNSPLYCIAVLLSLSILAYSSSVTGPNQTAPPSS